MPSIIDYSIRPTFIRKAIPFTWGHKKLLGHKVPGRGYILPARRRTGAVERIYDSPAT